MLASMIICIFLAALQVQSHLHGRSKTSEPAGQASSGRYIPPGSGLRARSSLRRPATPLSTHAKKDVLPVQNDVQA
ncbi:hypothetical protein Pst134EA_017918 [Puccinia striiformis f. sp. tritici]|uniref:Uncharacterized protein n=2 Tax=Puccinia striiformis TaxID=27350 RepID=A0A0L0VXJ3_9BASI|nr:hypothetical protein Pst134EA_017918 [Puccinia striiformis f. sp. tritici]KAH9461622.1 hypothetical protein Pst134EA_017918 [Puccinia striiformis f. sp. tritici]KAI9615985.1 hypothetical protein H4Q26_011237 [Puccinia striiformis f. sp. tritici PST-130]KNF03971.1 hypothetical protein PSTG_03054 [Puccinia striiformis f. sp. tritici PST-78]POW03939.1 hypothetical protein PSTT_10760 [Puccinia striiformis]